MAKKTTDAEPGSAAEDIAAEVERWSLALRDLMGRKHRSGRSLERELGWSSGYLSQVLLPGTPQLKVAHVLAILGALEVSPAEFFVGLYRLDRPAPDTESELRATVRAEIDTHGRRVVEAVLAGDEVKRLIARQVREEIARERHAAPEGGAPATPPAEPVEDEPLPEREG